MTHRQIKGTRRIAHILSLFAVAIAAVGGMGAFSASTSAEARTTASPTRDRSVVVGLGPVRIHQSQILNGTATTDSTGAAAVALTIAPGAGAHVAGGLKALDGQQIPLRVNGERVALQTVQTSDDGQTVLLRGFMTQEKAATVALRLSGKTPAPTVDQE